MGGPANESGSRPILWIQALRALAALTVAVVHLFAGFAWHVDDRLHGLPKGEQLANAAVALFFLISGCVMVVSSRAMFGRLNGPVQFWRRRAVRVVPPYWIATLLLAAVMASLALPVEPSEVFRSLGFVFWRAGGEVPGVFALFLWPGWTLFYELVFYALFGAFIWLGRGRAIAACGAVLVAMVIAGNWIAPGALLAFALTRPVLLLFVAGMAAALVLPRLEQRPTWIALLLVAGALACFFVIPAPQSHLGLGFLFWAGLPALLMFLAASGLGLRGLSARGAAVLGDASYAIYLLHVPFAHVWMHVFNIRLGHPGGSVGYLVFGLPLLIALSIAFYRWVERPMTDRLNRLLGGGPEGSGQLAKTHAP